MTLTPEQLKVIHWLVVNLAGWAIQKSADMVLRRVFSSRNAAHNSSNEYELLRQDIATLSEDVRGLRSDAVLRQLMAGYHFFEDASYSSNVEVRNQLITNARECFTFAATTGDPLLKVAASYQLAICYALLNDSSNHDRWLRKAMAVIHESMGQILRRVDELQGQLPRMRYEEHELTSFWVAEYESLEQIYRTPEIHEELYGLQGKLRELQEIESAMRAA